MAQLRIDVCVCGCGERGGIKGRGLIERCYNRMQWHGDLADYPRRTRRIEDVLDDYKLLRQDGYTLAQMAARIGMSRTALERALVRARERGLLAPVGA